MSVVAPLLIGVLHVCLMSLVREPHRRQLNAAMVAEAGAAHLSGGGFGAWEFVFTTTVPCCACRGLDSWEFIGVGRLPHTVGDVLHHFKGNPVIPFAEHSSFG